MYLRNRDTYIAGFDFLQQHGDRAAIHAGMEADTCMAAGDMEGAHMVANLQTNRTKWPS